MRIDGLPSSFQQGEDISFNFVFEGLADPNTTQYAYWGDVLDEESKVPAAICEGTGLGGVGRYTAHLDTSDQEDGVVTVTAVIDAQCPPGNFSVLVDLTDKTSEQFVSAIQEFRIIAAPPDRHADADRHADRHADTYTNAHRHADAYTNANTRRHSEFAARSPTLREDRRSA